MAKHGLCLLILPCIVVSDSCKFCLPTHTCVFSSTISPIQTITNSHKLLFFLHRASLISFSRTVASKTIKPLKSQLVRKHLEWYFNKQYSSPISKDSGTYYLDNTAVSASAHSITCPTLSSKASRFNAFGIR